jgi:hypothetical protein
MSDSGQADAAINALNGSNHGGRTLNINEARPKVDRGDRPFGGGGGGGRPGGGGGGGRGPQRRREPRW